MKRLLSKLTIGAFLASNAFAFHSDAITVTSVSGTTFQGYADQSQITHYGNGVFYAGGAPTKGMTATLQLSYAVPTTININLLMYGPTAGATCTAWLMSSNSTVQQGLPMSAGSIAGGLTFNKTLFGFDSNSQILSIYCELPSNGTLSQIKVWS